MAVPIQQFGVIEVRKPNVGENKPAAVEADVLIDTRGEPMSYISQSWPFGLHYLAHLKLIHLLMLHSIRGTNVVRRAHILIFTGILFLADTAAK